MSQQRLPLCSFSSPHLSSFVSYNDVQKLSAFCFLHCVFCFLLSACCLLLIAGGVVGGHCGGSKPSFM